MPERGFYITARRKGSPVLRWGRAKVAEVFGADLRSLAAFRIVLAVLVLADLANRATDLSVHYADKGVLPRSALLKEVMDRWQFSLNVMNGEPFFQALLFGVTALAALEDRASVRLAGELPAPGDPLRTQSGQLPRLRAAGVHRHPAKAFVRCLLDELKKRVG